MGPASSSNVPLFCVFCIEQNLIYEILKFYLSREQVTMYDKKSVVAK